MSEQNKSETVSYVSNVTGDLLDFPNDIHVIAHCCNPFVCFGGGIALAIKNRYPEAFEADKRTEKGDMSKLGTYSSCSIHGDRDYPMIVNMYAQRGISNNERMVDYEAMATCLESVYKIIGNNNQFRDTVIGFPKNMGSALAGGDWAIIEAMINTYATKYKVKTVIVELV